MVDEEPFEERVGARAEDAGAHDDAAGGGLDEAAPREVQQRDAREEGGQRRELDEPLPRRGRRPSAVPAEGLAEEDAIQQGGRPGAEEEAGVAHPVARGPDVLDVRFLHHGGTVAGSGFLAPLAGGSMGARAPGGQADGPPRGRAPRSGAARPAVRSGFTAFLASHPGLAANDLTNVVGSREGSSPMNQTMHLIAAALLLTLAPFALAGDDVSVSAYGECHDRDGSGGSDQAYVGIDATPTPPSPTIVTPSVTGAVAAVENLTDSDGEPAAGKGCTSDARDRVEVLVTVDGLTTGACYDGRTTVGGAC